jgi:hypothetical protein
MAAAHDYLQQSAGHVGGLRVVGEPPWLARPSDEWGEWACYESALNLACAHHDIRVICAYDAAELPVAVLAEAERTHPQLTGVRGTGPSSAFVDPCAFAPADEPEFPPAPSTAVTTDLDGASCDDVARFATRRAFDAGIFGRAARNFGLAAHETAAEFFPAAGVHARLTVWTERNELICEMDCRAPARPRILGYLPFDPTSGEACRLWTARRLCRLVRMRPTPLGTQVRLHHPTH